MGKTNANHEGSSTFDMYRLWRKNNCKTSNYYGGETYPTIRPPLSNCDPSLVAKWLSDPQNLEGCPRLFNMRQDDVLEVWNQSPDKHTLAFYGVSSHGHNPEAVLFNKVLRKSLARASGKVKPTKKKKSKSLLTTSKGVISFKDTSKPLILNRQALKAEILRMPTVRQKLDPHEALKAMDCFKLASKKFQFTSKATHKRRKQGPRKKKYRYCVTEKCEIPANKCTDYEWKQYEKDPRPYDEAFKQEVEQQVQEDELKQEPEDEPKDEPKDYEELYRRLLGCFDETPDGDKIVYLYEKCCKPLASSDGGGDMEAGLRKSGQFSHKRSRSPGSKASQSEQIGDQSSGGYWPKESSSRGGEKLEGKSSDRKPGYMSDGKSSDGKVDKPSEKSGGKPGEKAGEKSEKKTDKTKPYMSEESLEQQKKTAKAEGKKAEENKTQLKPKEGTAGKAEDSSRKKSKSEENVTKKDKTEKRASEKKEKESSQGDKPKNDSMTDFVRRVLPKEADAPVPENQTSPAWGSIPTDAFDEEVPTEKTDTSKAAANRKIESKAKKPEVQKEKKDVEKAKNKEPAKPQTQDEKPDESTEKHDAQETEEDKNLENFEQPTASRMGTLKTISSSDLKLLRSLFMTSPKPERRTRRRKKPKKKPVPVPSVPEAEVADVRQKECPCTICDFMKRRWLEPDTPLIREMKKREKERQLREYMRRVCHREYMKRRQVATMGPQHKCDPIVCGNFFCRNPLVSQYCEYLKAMQKLQSIMKRTPRLMSNRLKRNLDDLRSRIGQRICDCIENQTEEV